MFFLATCGRSRRETNGRILYILTKCNHPDTPVCNEKTMSLMQTLLVKNHVHKRSDHHLCSTM